MHFFWPARIVPGRVVRRVIAPFWLFVQRTVGDPAQVPDQHAVRLDEGRGKVSARRLVHERHELVWKTRHGAADADAADIRAAAHPGNPTALRHIALHNRPPTADLHQTLST